MKYSTGETRKCEREVRNRMIGKTNHRTEAVWVGLERFYQMSFNIYNHVQLHLKPFTTADTFFLQTVQNTTNKPKGRGNHCRK